ncbi:MAG: zinc ribbon domain-containing protein [Lachnospiraceae bacterium]|nr:zinc ribbon domain-containing protein [Lachnospiraceae bacterium]
MASSRTFALMNGVTIEKIGEHLVAWFQNGKNMIAEGGPAQGGYFVQAKDADDGWKKISGMTKALQVQLISADNCVVVNCDFGNWSDKVGAGVVGYFLFAPLAVTAAVGSVQQSKLPDQVFEEIEKFILSGGHSVVVGLGSRLRDNEIVCPVCKTKNQVGQKFCTECGNKLGKNCPHCGTPIDSGAKFCPQCGKSTVISLVCKECGTTLTEGQRFCPSCGAKQENVES